jgi:hypothetical protein
MHDHMVHMQDPLEKGLSVISAFQSCLLLLCEGLGRTCASPNAFGSEVSIGALLG